jgi:hypothetical protein
MHRCFMCRYEFEEDMISKFIRELFNAGLLIKIITKSSWNKDNECFFSFDVELHPQAKNVMIKEAGTRVKTTGNKFKTLFKHTFLEIVIEYEFEDEYITTAINHTVNNPVIQDTFESCSYYIPNLITSNNTKRDTSIANLDLTYCTEEVKELKNRVKNSGEYDFFPLQIGKKYTRPIYGARTFEEERHKARQIFSSNRKVKIVSDFEESDL